MIWYEVIILIFGFALLLKGGDLLVDGASALAYKFKISQIAIGLTIVAFGTSAPELIVNVFAALKGSSEITIGNVVGSNIINILLILGVASIIRPLITQKNTIWKEIPFALLSSVVLIILANDLILSNQTNIISRSDGLILLMFFIIFLVYAFSIAKETDFADSEIKVLSISKSIIFLVLGIIGLFIGGKLIVDSAVAIARYLEISEAVIGFTVIAFGTSLPELATSAIAAKKGKADIAIGNIVGSNIFNIFFILAISALIVPIPFDSNLNIDLIILFLASLLLFLTMFIGKKKIIDRWEGIFFLLFYLFYLLRFFLFKT